MRECRENALHKMLSGLESSTSIVNHRAGVLYHNLRMQRIYTEYCTRGSLYGLMHRHHDARHEAQMAQDDVAMDAAVIPEPFIWSLFETLAEAAYLMHKGTLRPDGPPFNDILHLDLKPANVFLTDNDDTGWPNMSMIARLGDFGCAFERQAQDNINPGDMTDIGTLDYMAPEQFSDIQALMPTLWTAQSMFMPSARRSSPS